MKITITLKEPARSQAEQALTQRGLRDSTSDPFLGPVFTGHLSWNQHDLCGFLTIKVYAEQFDEANYRTPQAVYMYPVSDIARMKFEP